MIRRNGIVVALLVAAAPLVSAPLAAQAMIFGEEPKLDPMRLKLKGELLVLRDSLATVEATSARLVRAKIGQTNSVVLSSARVLQSDCVRAGRAIKTMKVQMADVGTNDARGKGVINDYNSGLADLDKAMAHCDKSLSTTLAGKISDNDPIFRTALSTTDALQKYDVKLHVLLKTLQIPVDPKGFRSALKS